MIDSIKFSNTFTKQDFHYMFRVALFASSYNNSENYYCVMQNGKTILYIKELKLVTIEIDNDYVDFELHEPQDKGYSDLFYKCMKIVEIAKINYNVYS